MRELRNLFTDPLPTGSTGWSMDNGNNQGAKPEVSFSNGQMLIQGHATDGNSYALRYVMSVPPDDYVFAFNTRSGSSPSLYGNRLSTVMNTNWQSFGIIPASMLNARAVLRFANPTEQRIIFSFQAPNNEARVAYERMLLCTAEDYDAMLATGVEWFSGDSYRTGGGGA